MVKVSRLEMTVYITTPINHCIPQQQQTRNHTHTHRKQNNPTPDGTLREEAVRRHYNSFSFSQQCLTKTKPQTVYSTAHLSSKDHTTAPPNSTSCGCGGTVRTKGPSSKHQAFKFLKIISQKKQISNISLHLASALQVT